MTDKTRQGSGSTHIIRYALELGLLWIDGDGRDKVREALDALDTLEAQLEAIGAGGVQSLSAAPVAPTVEQVEHEVGMGHIAWDMVDPQKLIGAVLQLATSPTPPAEQQAAPKAAPGEPDPADIIAGALQISRGHAIEMMREACLGAAPQQEAQEPALFVSAKQLAALTDPDDPDGEHGRYLPVRKTTKGLFTQALYTAPQPAPAPLSDDVVKDAARYRWLRENWFTMTSSYQRSITFKVGEPRWSDITEEELDAAIDAARARLGEKT